MAADDGLMFPKKKWKRKRKRHKKSILHQKDGTCYLCMKLENNYRIHPVVHEHHIYLGKLRQISEAEGFKVYLCLRHHMDGPEAVHNNQKNLRFLQEECQEFYERTHSRQQFRDLIGKNFLEGEEQ